MYLKALLAPPSNWMERLRRGHWVWLAKEQEYAQVEFPYEPPQPGTRVGKIGIHRFSNEENRYRDIQSWYITSDGYGLDGSMLMLPTEGNLPEEPEPLPEPIIRQTQRTLEDLSKRIEALEAIVYGEKGDDFDSAG